MLVVKAYTIMSQYDLPWGLIILQGNWAVPPIEASTCKIETGLSIAANQLKLLTFWGDEVLNVGIPVVAFEQQVNIHCGNQNIEIFVHWELPYFRK